jgi:hypothetical protein
MELLDTLTVAHASGPRHIRLYRGDLAAIPPAEAVDLLVISASPGDYVPTPRSLIGALDRRGISVRRLAEEKEADLRDAFSSWVSKDLSARHPDAGFRRILCFEPPARGRAAEVVGDIFRALMPIALGDHPVRSVALPLVATGDRRQDPAAMLEALLHAAVHWLERGLPVEVIKIVVFSAEDATAVAPVFARAKAARAKPLPRPVPTRRYTEISRGRIEKEGEDAFGVFRGTVRELAPPQAEPAAPPAAEEPTYDCFVSYAREDEKEVEALVRTLKEVSPEMRIFLDKLEIQPGESWQAQLDEALEGCRKVIAVYSPSYLQSKVCIEEFNMARLRHRESDAGVLVPIYLRSVEKLPLYMRSLNYVDCREGDAARIVEACRSTVARELAD